MVEIKGMELVETISQNSDDSIVVFTKFAVKPLALAMGSVNTCNTI